MQQYIFLDILTESPLIIEETIADRVFSIASYGKKGFEIASGELTDLNFFRWELHIVCQEKDDINEIKNYIVNIIKSFKIEIKEVSLKEIEKKTWEIEEKIIEIKPFLIFNSLEKFKDFSSKKQIPIFINESTGFGTGSHETTFLCLQALVSLHSKEKDFNNILDLGTGSGILSIAIAKLFSGNILATDIDKLSLKASKYFLEKNNVADKVKVLESIGFNNIAKQNFDLIIANILLNPLIAMKQDFYQYLAKDGKLILSGILQDQSDKLKEEFMKEGFIFIKRKDLNNWSSLAFTK